MFYLLNGFAIHFHDTTRMSGISEDIRKWMSDIFEILRKAFQIVLRTFLFNIPVFKYVLWCVIQSISYGYNKM